MTIGRHPAPAKLWCEVVCHNCANFCVGEFFRRRAPIRALTEEAIKKRWRLRTDGQFECPTCTQRMLKNLGVSTEVNPCADNTPSPSS